MPRTKKPRKAYRRREVDTTPDLLLRLRHVPAESLQNVDLTALLSCDAIARGVGTEDHIWEIITALRFCSAIAKFFELKDEVNNARIQLDMLVIISWSSLNIANTLIKKGHPEMLPPQVMEPVKAAINLGIEMREHLSEYEILRAGKHLLKDHSCYGKAEYTHLIQPTIPKTWERAQNRILIAYLHERALAGLFDVRDGIPYFFNPDDDINIRITEPLVVCLYHAVLPDWKERYARGLPIQEVPS